ncbi:hypothetical protein XNC3_1950001 [Xenorhabdus nematophila F1]|nr:hypothetical protein XNC3_1950001 [Xenorhabdus nematophila F1]
MEHGYFQSQIHQYKDSKKEKSSEASLSVHRQELELNKEKHINVLNINASSFLK